MSNTANREPLALGVDVGGTFIKAAIVNTAGQLVQQFQAASPRDQESLRDFVHAAQSSASPLEGIGVGCKGIVNTDYARIDRLPGDLHFLEGAVLPEVLRTTLPVRADNDARTALIAEVLWGVARGKRNVVLLTLGTGVGGAAMVDGVILHGTAGIAGHFGHMTTDLTGALCMCGSRGCLETLFSSRAIEAEYLAHVHRGAATASDNGGFLATEAIFQLVAKGDRVAQSVIERAVAHLAAAVVTLLHIFDPELLIVGGSVANAGDQILAPLRNAIATHSRCMMGREVPAVQQSVIGYGGVLGAAGLIFLHKHLLKI